jgi:glycerol-3-phosphate O-acyltransferase
LLGIDNAKKIEKLVEQGDNVMILSNHQSEVDPQVLSVLLEQNGLPILAEKIIFMAGHKVTNDPVAIPFSMGRNLLCIHSKKHIKNPPEEMAAKQAHNVKAMAEMVKLAATGGNVFWVAPSGGRDRPDPVSGEFQVLFLFLLYICVLCDDFVSLTCDKFTFYTITF